MACRHSVFPDVRSILEVDAFTAGLTELFSLLHLASLATVASGSIERVIVYDYRRRFLDPFSLPHPSLPNFHCVLFSFRNTVAAGAGITNPLLLATIFAGFATPAILT